VPVAGELYAVYMVPHAKCYGLGQQMLERVQAWFVAQDMRSMIVWVLENNHHARRFYEAMGGKLGGKWSSSVGGFPVTELRYVWERL
jgi:hypothetical protein